MSARRGDTSAERLGAIITPEDAARARNAPGGYLDVLGAERPASTGRVQDLMLSGALPRIYERWWRPALGRAAKGPLGPSMSDERRIALGTLALRPGERALDVACGTGAFTRDLGRAVGPGGLSVGIDVSATMLERAVRESGAEVRRQVAYMRCDAARHPFRPQSFDGVCCFAALNLFGEPMLALDRMTDALAPGGRIAIFTSVRGRSTPLRALEALASRATGIRMFEREEVVGALEQRGFERIGLSVTGLTQFVGATLAPG